MVKQDRHEGRQMYIFTNFRYLSFKILKMFAESKLNRSLAVLILLPFSLAAAQTPLRILLLTGQNNHAWQETTPVLQDIYEKTAKCKVAVLTDPLQLAARLDSCDVLVSNWNNWPEVNSRPWGAENEKAFLSFLKKGGGLVLIHAASATMQTWPEFQAIAGATWQLGMTGHGKIHAFEVVAADTLQPFCHGLARFSMRDELWHKMAVQPHVRVLYKAFSDEKYGGSGAWEPVVLSTTYGKGRCFFSVLGHDVAAMQSDAWRNLVVQGTIWAAGSSW
jgi:type 1 glutamine amidotransferase